MAQGARQSGGVILFQNLSRLHDTIASRRDVEIESLDVPQPSQVIGRLAGRLRFLDGSLFEFMEEVRVKGKRRIEKLYYSYHYQRADGSTIFPYDNASHHREAKTFPHHKHIGGKVESANAPDLHEVLQEIDRCLRSKSAPS